MDDFLIKHHSFSDEETYKIAALHVDSIHLGFMSQLGVNFLRYLYMSIDKSEETELIVAIHNNEVVGFITGATSLKPILKYMIRHYFLQIIIAIFPSLCSIQNIKKIFGLLKYSKAPSQVTDQPEAELLSLAVKKEYRGSGVSQVLFSELVAEFKKKGHDKFKIIVGKELGPAKTFYRKMGAIQSGTLNLHSNSQSIIFTVEIT